MRVLAAVLFRLLGVVAMVGYALLWLTSPRK